MKKFVPILIILCLLTSVFAPVAGNIDFASRTSATGAEMPDTSVRTVESLSGKSGQRMNLEYDFLPASADWSARADAPAQFSGIDYDLAEGVVRIEGGVMDNIASAGQLLSGGTAQKYKPSKIIERGGYIDKQLLETAAGGGTHGQAVESGTVMVDEASGTAFKVVSETRMTGEYAADPALATQVAPLLNKYAVAKPELHEVLDNFTLPEQTVTLTNGNITGFAPNVERSLVSDEAYHAMVRPLAVKPLAVTDEDKDFKYINKEGSPLIALQFKDEKLEGKVGNSTITLTFNGGLGIGKIELDGKYTWMDGYRIAVTADQEAYLTVELDAEIKEEIMVPLIGISIPFGIGSVHGGLFLIVNIDGTFRLEIKAREYTSLTMGIQGSTFLYLPTSFKPIFDKTVLTDGDVSLNGKLEACLKFGPMLDIELFGFDLVGAGVLLGAGVKVQVDNTMLDIEVYALFNVYIKILGKTFNLINYMPTLFKKQQPDTKGYKVEFLETYIMPGRVGGTIEEEPAKAGEPYLPAEGLDYRIWVVPDYLSSVFTIQNRSQYAGKVRYYPASGYAKTNAEGEFFQEKDGIIKNGETAYIEFKSSGGSWLYGGPAKAILPFDRSTVSYGDYFNDYVVGQVMPKRVINWSANRFTAEPEELYEWAYYDNKTVVAEPFIGSVSGGTTRTTTDRFGYFDTRNPLKAGHVNIQPSPVNVFAHMDPAIPVPPGAGINITLDIYGAIITQKIYGFQASAQFSFVRVLEEVPDSYEKIYDGDRIVDRMQYDEYIYIQNPLGKRAVTEADIGQYLLWGFSTQDVADRAYMKYVFDTPYVGKKAGMPIIQPDKKTITLTPQLDEYGNATGTTLLKQRVTVEWVWQPHPNPVRITSAAVIKLPYERDGGFQVTANGYPPFTYSLKPAPGQTQIPAGISINASGRIAVRAFMAPGEYNFIVRVEERPALIGPDGIDPKKGNALSEPCEQLVTLILYDGDPGESFIGQDAGQTAQPQALAAPLTDITVTCDHEDDVYTLDRYTVNGARFVRWDTYISLKIEGATTGWQVLDETPACDNYHYMDPVKLSQADIAKLTDQWKNTIYAYENGNFFDGRELSAQALLEDIYNYKSGPAYEGYTSLEYGSLVEKLNGAARGSYNVKLDSSTGSMLTGKYFTAIEGKNISLTFNQQGVAVTFNGKDIQGAAEYDVFNIGVTGAQHRAEMLAAVGGAGYTYGFNHHGALPGMATFSVQTDIARGAKVNVYKYEAASGKFLQVAANLKVGEGGVVTYKNNTMSEYIITAETIDGAEQLEVMDIQGGGFQYWWIIAAGGAAILLAGALLLVIYKKKKAARK